MDRLRAKGHSLGLTEEEIHRALSLGRSNRDLAWFVGSDLLGRAQEAAHEAFEQERVLEYECYDAQWRSQGRAVVTLRDWEDKENVCSPGLMDRHQMGTMPGTLNTRWALRMGCTMCVIALVQGVRSGSLGETTES